jgi:uncharacterized protein YjdB
MKTTTLLVLLLATLSCSKDATQQTVAAPLVPVARIDVVPGEAVIIVGDTQRLTAVAKDAKGNILPDRTVTWSLSDTSRAKISADGLVIGRGLGWVKVIAPSAGVTGSGMVGIDRMRPPPGHVAFVAVDPIGIYLKPGDTVRLKASARDVNGFPVLGRPVQWHSQKEHVLRVDQTGFVTALNYGKTSIIATIDSIQGNSIIEVAYPVVTFASVEVTPASATVGIGTTHKLTAIVKDANGNVLKDRTVTWTSSDKSMATVNAAGLVTALGAGTVTITATSEDRKGTSIITVQ